jgi:TrwC relaxase
MYHHDTSRELDPQLHTYTVAANLTYDGTEGRWKALQASGIYERRAYLTEVYRNSLAREVGALGYEIDNRTDARGRDCGFEIRGLSRELLDRFNLIRGVCSAMRRSGSSSGRTDERRRTTKSPFSSGTRGPTKLTEISTEEVRARQTARVNEKEPSAIRLLRRSSLTSRCCPPDITLVLLTPPRALPHRNRCPAGLWHRWGVPFYPQENHWRLIETRQCWLSGHGLIAPFDRAASTF